MNTRQVIPARGIPDWEAARIFLEVARHGSFRSAAEAAGQSVNAIRRRIADLERSLGVTLLTRHVDGIRATAEGEQILAAVERMEVASFELMRGPATAGKAVAGEVKLAVTEGLGLFWITPRLVEFQRAYPALLIDLACAMQSVDILRLEADVAVQLSRPEAKDLRVVKLGRMHVMPFAAQSYIETFGVPKTVEDLVNHRIVLQVAEQVPSTADYNRLFPGVAQIGTVAIRTNLTSAHFWAVAKGSGIGMLPTYAHAIGAKIMPVDIGFRVERDIWLTYHPDSGKIPRVRRLIDWLVDAFSPKKFPWFRDEFIHPDDLPHTIDGKPIVNYFEGFFGAERR
jgi:DNA-binding transcriptional LysR family regulator